MTTHLSDFLDKVSKKLFDCKGAILANNESIFSTVPSEDIRQAKFLIGISTDHYVNWETFRLLVDDEKTLLQTDRCIGSYFGMILGDYLGTPIEFSECVNSSNTIQFVDSHIDEQCVIYLDGICNNFALEIGQWTDDAAMGACIADSLIVSVSIGTMLLGESN